MYDVNFGLLLKSQDPDTAGVGGMMELNDVQHDSLTQRSKTRVFPPQNKRHQDDTFVVSRQQCYKNRNRDFSLDFRPPTRRRERISNPLIIHHYVLAGALCPNPDPLNPDVVTLSCGSNDGPTAEGNYMT